MKKIIFNLCLLLLLFACKSEPAHKPTTEREAPVVEQPPQKVAIAPSIGFFDGFPDDLMGCSCYFSTTEADFNGDRYVYLDNQTEYALLMINGEKTRFQLGEYQDNDGIMTREWSNEKYKLKTVVTPTKKATGEEEVYPSTIEVSLYSAEGEVLKTISGVGECGC